MATHFGTLAVIFTEIARRHPEVIRLLQQDPQLLKHLYAPQESLFEQTSIRAHGDFSAQALGENMLLAFQKSLAIQHNLPDWIVCMYGMSGKKYRYFINNLVSLIERPVYLEVGTFLGSTTCAAAWNNSAQITCIDNWSEFGGTKEEFLLNFNRASDSRCKFSLYESDFRKINFSALGVPANIYLFDGPHTFEDHFDGIVSALPALDERFILIVDDFNFVPVREGTLSALKHLHLREICAIEIRTTTDGSHAKQCNQFSDWHNGCYITLLEK